MLSECRAVVQLAENQDRWICQGVELKIRFCYTETIVSTLVTTPASEHVAVHVDRSDHGLVDSGCDFKDVIYQGFVKEHFLAVLHSLKVAPPMPLHRLTAPCLKV
jgi:hypothetical protein